MIIWYHWLQTYFSFSFYLFSNSSEKRKRKYHPNILTLPGDFKTYSNMIIDSNLIANDGGNWIKVQDRFNVADFSLFCFFRLKTLIKNQLINVDIEQLWKRSVCVCSSQFMLTWIMLNYYKCVRLRRKWKKNQILFQTFEQRKEGFKRFIQAYDDWIFHRAHVFWCYPGIWVG